jgi:AraC-like DNA-binding protein
MMLHFILSILLFFAVNAIADSTFILKTGQETRTVPWDFALSDTTIKISEYAAMHGQAGIFLERLTGGRRCFLIKQIPFMEASWQRVSFNLDSCWRSGITDSMETQIFEFMSYGISDVVNVNNSNTFLRVSLQNNGVGKQTFLVCSLFPYDGDKKEFGFKRPIDISRTYYLETHIVFHAPESLKFDLYLNGAPVWSQNTNIKYSRKYLEFTARNGSPRFRRLNWHLFLDDFAVSEERLPPLPAGPSGCMQEIEGNKVTLTCRRFSAGYTGEKLIASNWKLFDDSGSPFPLFNKIVTDSNSFFKCSVPFELDSGVFHWSVGFQNNLSDSVEWSNQMSFHIKEMRAGNITIDSVCFLKEGEDLAVSTVVPDTWYNMQINMKPAGAWKQSESFYFLIWLNNASYTMGHAGNKGGKFLRASSYIFNISVDEKWSTYGIYEKSVDNTALSKYLAENAMGLYIDGAADKTVIDTAKGHVSFRVKLLPGADYGRWQISTCIRNSNGDFLSNCLRSFINISSEKDTKKEGTGPAGLPLKLIILLCFAFMGLLYLRFRKKEPELLLKPDAQNREMQRIIDFIEQHMNEEITVPSIRSELGLSRQKFNSALKSKEIPSLPFLLNNLRVNKAKELMKNPKKNVSEICFEVGFSDANYFTKVFKSQTGLTPSEFRQKL